MNVTVTVELPVEELRALHTTLAELPKMADKGYWDHGAIGAFIAACRDTPIPRPLEAGDRVHAPGDTVGQVVAVHDNAAWVLFAWEDTPVTFIVDHLVRIGDES